MDLVLNNLQCHKNKSKQTLMQAIPFLLFLIHWYVLVSSSQLVGRIFFRCFGTFCFVCIVLPFVDIFLIFLLSSVLSGLFPQVVLLFFLVLPFPFCLNMFQCFSFVLLFLPVFETFLSAFPVEFSIHVLIFCSSSLKEHRFSHKLILLLVYICQNLIYFFRFYLDCSPFYVP